MIDKELKNKKDCTGCHACSNICSKKCISMKGDREGFLYPSVDYCLCIQCNKCVKVCPLINQTKVDNNPIAYSCINKNEKIRLESSSGGIFTLIAEKILDKGGVVFGARFNHEFEVEHSFVGSKKSLCQLRGSKYVQSRIGNSYKQAKEFLDLGRETLFSGTPCQIAGLQSYLGKPYNNLFTLDIICHGVPSPEVWRKYVEFREIEAGAPTKRIDFRLKDEGWKRYSISFLFKNNMEYQQAYYKDLYMNIFLKDICLRPSCYDCAFKTIHRGSDITLADFWGIQNLLPDMDDDKGTSLIFINDNNGQSMFNRLKNGMIYKEIDINKAVSYNLSAIKTANLCPKRNDFFENLEILPFNQLVTQNEKGG